MTASLTRQMCTSKRRHRWMVAITMLCLIGSAPPTAAGELEPVPGRPAADALEIQDLRGRLHQLDDYRGQVVLVNFWATWCPPCVAEMPSLQRLYQALSAQPFALLAVSMGEGEPKVRQFKTAHSIDFPLLLDNSSDLSHRWGVDFLPTSFLIDTRGRLRYQAYGEVDWNDNAVRATLDTLLAEAGPDPKPSSD